MAASDAFLWTRNSNYFHNKNGKVAVYTAACSVTVEEIIFFRFVKLTHLNITCICTCTKEPLSICVRVHYIRLI